MTYSNTYKDKVYGSFTNRTVVWSTGREAFPCGPVVLASRWCSLNGRLVSIWDEEKETANVKAHGLNFVTATLAFLDPQRLIVVDEVHGLDEDRYFCLGKVDGRVATIRFACRDDKIRIIGAGFWRKGRKLYERENAKNSQPR